MSQSTDNAVERATVADSRMRELVVSIGKGGTSSEVLRHKRADVMVARSPFDHGRSVIVKLWNRRGPRQLVRRWLGRGEPWREARALHRLNAVGAAAPRLLGELRLDDPSVPYTHALVIEDLGKCVRVVEHVADLVSHGLCDQLAAVEADVITITGDMIRAGVLDLDHSLNNMLIPPAGVAKRVDLEFAVCCADANRRPRLYGTMLGRLIGTYTFAVQPGVERVFDFADRLYRNVSPPASVRRRAQQYVGQMMAGQKQSHGVDFEPELPG